MDKNEQSEKKLFQPIMVDSQTKNRIEYISKITCIPQSRLIFEIIDCMAHVYANFTKATFSSDYSALENTITITVHGTKRTGCLEFGKVSSEQELSDEVRKRTCGE
jgi:hypothetical protein